MKALNDDARPPESLLQQHCPNGVESRPLGEVIERVRRKVKNLNNVNVYSASNSQGLILSTNFRDRKLYSEDISNYTLIQKGEFAYSPARLNIGSIALLTDEAGAVSPIYVVFKIDERSLNQKFLFYFLESPTILRKIVSLTGTGAGFRSDLKRWERFPIPLPPLEIQYKIVEILDAFTELEAELEAELEVRLKQYHYCRNKLLSHGKLESHTVKSRNDNDPATLAPYVRSDGACETLDNSRKPITKSKRTQGIYPYYGANGIQDYVNEYVFDGDFLLMGEDGSVISKDNNPVLNWVSGKFWVNNHAHILKERSNTTNLRFIFFYLQTCDISSIVRGVPPKINQQNLKTIQIPLPPLVVQDEIVELLDKFDTLTDDLTNGTPTEIETRKKQYEYYREKLLSFIAKD